MLVPLTKGFCAEVDDEDAPLVVGRKWCAGVSGKGFVYAVSGHMEKRTLMHRLIVGLKKGDPLVVDHIDGNTLNNRRSNLRVCTQAENARNAGPQRGSASKYRGVQKQGSKWISCITKDGVKTHLGFFSDQVLAAVIYNQAGAKAFGQFFKPNKINNEAAILHLLAQQAFIKQEIERLCIEEMANGAA